ncbi:hypothetical protein DESC_970071 [Desulfosarcina cetonica]|nr:hypothetical protein DESC_970071 [Desulfosarcina cetonica]
MSKFQNICLQERRRCTYLYLFQYITVLWVMSRGVGVGVKVVPCRGRACLGRFRKGERLLWRENKIAHKKINNE